MKYSKLERVIFYSSGVRRVGKVSEWLGGNVYRICCQTNTANFYDCHVKQMRKIKRERLCPYCPNHTESKPEDKLREFWIGGPTVYEKKSTALIYYTEPSLIHVREVKPSGLRPDGQ